jgi:hypothetical protein
MDNKKVKKVKKVPPKGKDLVRAHLIMASYHLALARLADKKAGRKIG